MEISLQLEDLKKGLNLVKPAVPKRPSHPILGNVLIQPKEGQISLTGFDLSLGIQTGCSAEISGDNSKSFTLPAQLLSDIVGKISKGGAVLSVEEEKAGTVTACLKSNDGGEFRLRGMSGIGFPSFPSLAESQCLSVNPQRFREGIQYTSFASSVEEAKQVLKGIRLSVSQAGLEFAATDGHRLAVLRCSDHPCDHDTALTIPATALQQVNRVLSSGKESSCQIYFDDTQARIETDESTITTRLLEGMYPDYYQLIPKEFKGNACFDQKTFLRKLDAVGLFSDIVRMELESESLYLSADGNDLGNAKEPVSASVGNNTDTSHIGFSNRYLTPMGGFPGNTLGMYFNGKESPVVFFPDLEEGLELTYLVMPVRISE